MKKYICSLFFITLLISGFAQKESKIVNIDGIEVDLTDVDVDKGEILNRSAYYERIENGQDSIFIEDRMNIFVSPSYSHYLVASELLRSSNWGWKTALKLEYRASNGDLLFESEYIGEMSALISYSGKLIVMRLASEEKSEIVVLDFNGDEIYGIDTHMDMTYMTTRKYHHMILMLQYYPDHSKSDCILIFTEFAPYCRKLKIDKSLTRIYSVARNESCFAIENRDTIYVYDTFAELQWSLPKELGVRILLLNQIDLYLVFRPKGDTLIELRSSYTNLPIWQINRNYFGGSNNSFQSIGFTDDSCKGVYIKGCIDTNCLLYFFNLEGVFINSVEVPSNIKDIRFGIVDDKYAIINNQE